jgi:nitrite reductase/ring-hydroxylating ferredoxin subunit
VSDAVRVLPDAASLREGDGVRFTLVLDGVSRPAFAVRWRGGVFAYVNSCRHESLELDFRDGRFLEDDGSAIVCVHHGALYRPDTGECFDGPCRGASLTPLALEHRGAELWCTGRRT